MTSLMSFLGDPDPLLAFEMSPLAVCLTARVLMEYGEYDFDLRVFLLIDRDTCVPPSAIFCWMAVILVMVGFVESLSNVFKNVSSEDLLVF